jgi:hypothetical protein
LAQEVVRLAQEVVRLTPGHHKLKSFSSLIDGGSGLNSTDLFGATDCINGTILPKELFGTYQTNYTVLIDVHRKYGPQNKLDQVTMLRF